MRSRMGMVVGFSPDHTSITDCCGNSTASPVTGYALSSGS